MAGHASPLFAPRTLALAAMFLGAAAVPPLAASAWLLTEQPAVTVGPASGMGTAPVADVTVRGCIERDATSRTPIYKLAESAGSRVFRLTAPKEVDVPSHVGQTVDATGTVSDAGGRQTREPEFVVTKLTVVRDSCSGASAR